jgi:hypothetical protein
MADIKLIKFTSGEEIICELISAGETAKVIKNGVTLVYHQTVTYVRNLKFFD